MDKKKILQSVMHNIQKVIHRKLSELEEVYVRSQLKQFINNKTNEELKIKFPLFMDIILDGIKNPKTIDKAMAEPHEIDIHELLKKQIKNQNKKIIEPKHPNDITSILGMDKGISLLRTFNPQAALRTAYVLLDRKYHLRNGDENTTFRWSLSLSGQSYNTKNSAVITTMPTNIIGVRIIPFSFPYSTDAMSFLKRISITIQELDMNAYISGNNRYKFHFLFNIIPGAAGGPTELKESTNSSLEFWLGKPIQEISTLTLQFGNPFNRLTLNPDRLHAVITKSGIQTLLTFSQPHFVVVPDRVTIENFTTDQPTQDIVEIELINNPIGWDVSSVTATTITINIDLSGLVGTIQSQSIVYFESKRFIIPLELKYFIE